MDALLMLVPLGWTHGRQGGGDFSLDAGSHLIRKGDLVYKARRSSAPTAWVKSPMRCFR